MTIDTFVEKIHSKGINTYTETGSDWIFLLYGDRWCLKLVLAKIKLSNGSRILIQFLTKAICMD